jgi:hypothetical protein
MSINGVNPNNGILGKRAENEDPGAVSNAVKKKPKIKTFEISKDTLEGWANPSKDVPNKVPQGHGRERRYFTLQDQKGLHELIMGGKQIGKGLTHIIVEHAEIEQAATNQPNIPEDQLDIPQDVGSDLQFVQEWLEQEENQKNETDLPLPPVIETPLD